MPAKTANKSGKLTKEEELLLLESSRNVSTATSALFYGNAFIVSVMPLCKLTHFTTVLVLLFCSHSRLPGIISLFFILTFEI